MEQEQKNVAPDVDAYFAGGKEKGGEMMMCPQCSSQNFEEMEMTKENTKKANFPSGRYGVCHDCKRIYNKNEVWSRVVGYLRPTVDWNPGKRAEFSDRVTYKLGGEDADRKD